jgi:predicted nucleic acid-binding protein
MIVIDASAMIEALVGRNADDKLLDALQVSLHAPHLLDVEVVSVLRGLALGRKLAPDAAEQARTDYFALTIARYELSGLADRVWELRHSYTTYDASYLALAEALDAPFYTCDRKFASAARHAHRAEILLLSRTH